MILPTTEKYIIFLHPRFFNKSLFSNVYTNIKNNLENKGIVVFNIKTAVSEIKKHFNYNKNDLSFDDTPFPNTNILYIHLFNGQYYNDSIYIKKKVENEREMLILLAGKLGVKTINYKTEIIKTIISKANASLNVKGLKNGIHYNKEVSRKEGIQGKEVYLNRGAPAYLNSESIDKIEEHIQNTLGNMKSNVFNYNFYKYNPKLESFVYKRFEFKMLKLEYTIDTEDISDISFIVKSCFVDYGINISFEKTVTYNETIKYTLEFFNDAELKKAYFNANQAVKDNFYSIREQYDLSVDKDLAVQYIIEYVTKLAKKCYYKNKTGYGVINNFGSRLSEFIKDNPYGTFEGICHQFRSSIQIKNWLYKALSDDSLEILDDDYNTNNNAIHRGNTYKNTQQQISEIHGYTVSPRSNSNNITHVSNNITQNNINTCGVSSPVKRSRLKNITPTNSQNNSPANTPPGSPTLKRSQETTINKDTSDELIGKYKTINSSIITIQQSIDNKKVEIENINKELEYLNNQLQSINNILNKIENDQTKKNIKQKIVKNKKTKRPSIDLTDIFLDQENNITVAKFKHKELLTIIEKKQEQLNQDNNKLLELMSSFDEAILNKKIIEQKLINAGISLDDVNLYINKQDKQDNQDMYSETNV